jgi:Ca2+:H+ antiporter
MRFDWRVLRPGFNWLLIFVPISLAFEFSHQALAVFISSAIAIIPLAGLIGRSTDQLAIRVGPRLGGLLNATFGNLTELIVGILLVVAGEFEVVKASLVGSIIGNLLLVLGFSFALGGFKHSEQRFNARAAGVHSASLLLAVTGLAVPALLAGANPHLVAAEKLVVSAGVAATLILLYVAALVFMQFTHEHLFRTPESDENAEWSTGLAVGVLLGAAVLVGLESELLVSSLEPALKTLGLSTLFVGLILIPIIANAAEHSSAVFFAWRNKLDVTLEIAVGSSTQVALFLAPSLVIISLLIGHPMDFIFQGFEVVAVALATVIVAIIALDGRSNWLEGLQLISVYVIIGLAAFFL